MTTDARLQAAATILAGMLVALSNSDPEAEDLPSINACAQGAWKHLAALEAAAPEPVIWDSRTTAERVEPTKQEWLSAVESTSSFLPTWQYCRDVSDKAYVLAAQKGKT